MTSLYEVLKAQKMGAAIAPDYFTALWAGATGGGGSWETVEYTGAVPIEIIAAGEPLIDYLISGNMSQTGTPSPQSIIMPQECGERSAQLIPYPFYSSDGEYAGVQFTTDNGRIIANGTLTSGLLYYLWRPEKFQAGTYTMSVKGKHSGATIYFRDTTHNVSVAYIYGAQEGGRSVTFTVAEEISAMVYVNAGSGTVDFDCTIMLNAGEEALPFEPTNGYKLDISSGNTTTPIYLGEVETERRVKKLVLTGQEDIAYSPLVGGLQRFIIHDTYQTSDYSIGFCSHYNYEFANNNNTVYHQSSNAGYDIYICDNNYNSAANFKAYLASEYSAGHPVTVWYVLANPTTAVVNEPLRKIGDYADTISAEQAGVNIPTVEGSNVIDVLTTLKPSEIYLKYKGRESE